MQIMDPQALIGTYTLWHYSHAVKALIAIWRNFIFFFYHLFSLPLLVRTLFAPWRRLAQPYPDVFDAGEIFGTFITNTLMRIVGAVLRLVFIIIGTTALVVTGIVGIAACVLWLAAPFLVLAGIIGGTILLL